METFKYKRKLQTIDKMLTDMGEQNKMTSIKEAIEFRGIVMNRVPAWAKTLFKELSKQEFENDYGQTLAAIIKESMEYRQFKELLLSNNLSLFPVKEEPVEETGRKSINGKPIKFTEEGKI